MKKGHFTAILVPLLCLILAGCSLLSPQNYVDLSASQPSALSADKVLFRKQKDPEPVSVLPIDGTAGANQQEGFASLFDSSSATKWCVTDMKKPYVIFEASEPIRIDGYILVTGNDTKTYSGRNPTHWQLYGANGKSAPAASSSKWKRIDQVKNDNTLTAKNETAFSFGLSKTAKEYKYYKLVIEKVRSGSIMQLSELLLVYDDQVTVPYVAPVEIIPNFVVTDADPTYFLGSTYVYDDISLDLQMGDSVSLYNSMVAGSGIQAYGWQVVEGDADCVSLERDGATCLLLARKQGKIKISANMSYRLIGGGMFSREYFVTVNIGPRTTTPSKSFGSVADGHCPRCFGHKKIDTKDGIIPCPWCQGSGKWTN